MAPTVVEKGFLYVGISEDELRYSFTASLQKTIWQTSTYKAVYLDWSKKFQETGCLCKGKSSGRPPVSEETVELDYRIDVCCVTKGSHIEHL